MKLAVILLTTVLSLVCISAAFAQLDRQATATVPFEFAVETTVLPAGFYAISTPANNVIMIKNVDTGVSVYALEKNIKLALRDQTFGAAEPKLVFRQDGQHHVLHQVLLAGDDHRHDLVHGPKVLELASIQH